MEQHRVSVQKTGRYFVLGKPGRGVRTVIFACHGYAQLADDFLSAFKPDANSRADGAKQSREFLGFDLPDR